MQNLEDKTLLLVVAAVSILFGWILWPYSGAILWAIVLAIMFAPLNRWFSAHLPRSPNLSALATFSSIVLLVLLPTVIVVAQIIRQAQSLYVAFQSGDLRPEQFLPKIIGMLPRRVTDWMKWLELPSPDELVAQIGELLKGSTQFIAGQALNVGQITFTYVVTISIMLYLLFFVLRDGSQLRLAIGRAIPLRLEHKRILSSQFAVATRATVKGSVVVALVQGALGGLMFWYLGMRAPLLLGVLMSLTSLVPVVGGTLVWGPIALFLLATGAQGQALMLTFYCVVVIGLVDNLLRPLLVGKQTRLPDWLVLLTSLGGIDMLGTNGILIGPVVATLFIAAWQVLSHVRYHETNTANASPAASASPLRITHEP